MSISLTHKPQSPGGELEPQTHFLQAEYTHHSICDSFSQISVLSECGFLLFFSPFYLFLFHCGTTSAEAMDRLLPHPTLRIEVMMLLLWMEDVGSTVLLLRQKREMNTDFQTTTYLGRVLGVFQDFSFFCLAVIQISLVHRIQNF